jgi:hypothetical protein
MASVLYDGLIGAVIGTVIGVRKWRHAAAVKKLIAADEIAEQTREDSRLAREAQYAEAVPEVIVELGARNPRTNSYELILTCERAIVSGSITLMPGYDPGLISGLAPYGDDTPAPTVNLPAAQAGETIRTTLWIVAPDLIAGQTLKLQCDITTAPGHRHQLIREISMPSHP